MNNLQSTIKSIATKPSYVLASLFALCVNQASATDMLVYLDQLTLPPEETRPNVVFVLDTSGSMGLPVTANSSGNFSSGQETSRYVSSTVYPGEANYSGGAGDSDYYYLYARPNTYADQFIYFNKVHKDHMTCNMSTVDDSTPYTTSSDRFVYDSGATDWLSGGTSSTRMCAEHQATCNFDSGASGPLVDCNNEENYVSIDGSSGTGLYVVSANFHNYLQQYYRYTTLLTVVKDLIDTNLDINMTMMRFNGGNGGYVFHESILAYDADNAATTAANQQSLRDALDDIYEFDDSTPLTETLWEAARYLRGEGADFGNDSGTNTPSAAYSSGTTYNSPIDYACQKSHIIVLTDGAPTSDNGRDTNIASSSYTGSSCSGNCLDEFAGWIHTDTSNSPSNIRDHASGAGFPDEQEISVHTIGFGSATDATLLNNAATNGGGLYYSADNAAALATAFTNILDQIDYESDTSVAPAVAVNTYSGLSHRQELYFALFKPDNSPRWTGNIKKYKLVNGVIMDASSPAAAAIDPATGYFADNAESYWFQARDIDGDGALSTLEQAVDGSDINRGGVAYQLSKPTERKMYTYTGTSTPIHNGTSLPAAVSMNDENLDLETTNAITDNANIAANPSLLGASVTTTSDARDIINWVRGGITDEPSPLTALATGVLPPNYFYADGIHNPPVAITYTTNESCVTQDPPPTDMSTCFDDTIFSSTNMGTFHAFDPDDGTELFAFVPQELLPNLTTYYEGIGAFTDKVYGLDGPMSVWRHDDNKDGDITTGGNDHVYIYQPMRRGGTDIYAFDVTNRDDPKLMWQIVGTGLDASPAGDYQDLAQTWSAPQRTAVRWGCTSTCEEREVLFFGGGYDPVHDTNGVSPTPGPTTSSKGNAIYMVDAKTSELLWSAGSGAHHDINNSLMANSIAADVSPIDINGDGFVDFLFAIDIQGNLWRIDFDDEASSAAAIASSGDGGAGIIAELGGTGSNFRRFYNAPDVAYFAPRGQPPQLTISVASGHRADPREEVINDRLYVIYDFNVFTPPSDYNYVGGSSTIDETDLFLADTTPTNNYGWYLPLAGTGEKGLSKTVTFDGQILMSTFLPAATNTCTGTTGEGRIYFRNALSGVSEINDADGNQLPFISLEHGGIPPEPAIIFGTKEVCVANCDGTNDVMETQTDMTACIGTECIDFDFNQPLKKTYWREN